MRSVSRFGVKAVVFAIALLCCAAAVAAATSQSDILPIDKGWRFRQLGDKEWLAARVPGCVHTDLLAAGAIEDPFYRDNEQKLQWIGKTDWEYAAEFNLEKDFLDKENIDLVFEGLDTYAEVYLNDKLVLAADNMFRSWRVRCKETLRGGANDLRIVFYSPINRILPVMQNLPYELPAGNDQGEKTSVFTRKAPYQFGWDWGPRFVTCGIWRPVRLEAWRGARIEAVHYRQEAVDPFRAELTAEIEVVASAACSIDVAVRDAGGSFAEIRKAFNLKAGSNYVCLPIRIENPILWWPRGLGEQHLYTIECAIAAGGEVVDERRTRVGLRSLELRRREDRWGRSFEFVVNGAPVFAKGANWIPADSFPSRVTPERYRGLLGSCAAANFNMLRVWGGGIYESDIFYDLCDELGLMVWQDFMFACALYPGDPEFLESVRSEAVDNAKRLRNHACLVLWCGNNEMETGWFDWGWKKQYPPRVREDYDKLFQHLLPAVCALYDPGTPYWPSSPSSDAFGAPNSPDSGDNHYWDVWHGGRPFSDYENQYPRFSSEYGFQSFPLLGTVSTFALPADYDIESPVMTAHQKHPRGNRLIREYMLRDFAEPKDFASFLYVSQVLQAEGIKTAAEHLRRIRPRCMGSLYWQANDCWPVASWSSIDYTGTWKALQHYARRFYGDVLVSPARRGDRVDVYVVSDLQEPLEAFCTVRVMDFGGGVISEVGASLVVAPGASDVVLSETLTDLIGGSDPGELFLHCSLVSAGAVISENSLFFAPFKELQLDAPRIEWELHEAEGGALLRLSSARLARAVFLESSIPVVRFGDNFFDLLPGSPRDVFLSLPTDSDLDALRTSLKVMSLAEAFRQ